MRHSRIVMGLCLVGVAGGFFAAQLWSRLMIDQSMVDVRDQAEKAPLVFRGRVLTVEPDPRVVPVLGPSLSSSDRQIRYLALSGLNTIANAEECSTRHDANEDDEAAFERETASCKAWWEREGKYRSWTRN